MAYVTEPSAGWTVGDLFDRFGPIPLSRIRMNPPPGTGTEADVLEIHDRENRLYELVDGVLVEKAAGTYESYLAGILVQRLWNFVEPANLGIVLPADGMMRIAPGLVRIPDVSFISWSRLPGREVPDTPIANLAPDLAIEVISKGNTRQEMTRKLREYFDASVREVWYVYPRPRREMHVFTSFADSFIVPANETLSGREVLRGFALKVSDLLGS
jgi:Uma2 family endonuclease